MKNWKRIIYPSLGGILVLLLVNSGHTSVKADVPTSNPNGNGQVFASSDTVPLLQFPEGLTSWNGGVYSAAYNVVTPTDSRIFVFDLHGKLLNTIGGQPGQELVSTSQLLGLIINHQTGDLFASANGTGHILRIQHPDSAHPVVSIYATYPQVVKGASPGPEDMAFNAQGTLYASDSNQGVIFAIPPGGGKIRLVVGPPGTGAPVSDHGLLQEPVLSSGLTPNGLVFSLDYRTLYAANTWQNSIVAFDVNPSGDVTGNARIFAQHLNPDLEEYPTGLTELLKRGNVHIGPQASTPLNGPDGLALDALGRVWVASNLGDQLNVLDHNGNVVATYGRSAVTDHGLLNQPASLTFVGQSILTTNLSIFTNTTPGIPHPPFRIVAFDVGVTGAGGNGNY